MLYEKYERKVTRNVLMLKQIYKFRFLLITIASVAFLSFSGFAVTKGTVYDVSVPESYIYSEDVEFHSKAMFSSITYNYRKLGEETWTTEKPTEAGDYQVEISSNQLFGGTSSQILDFTIEPKSVNLNLEDTTVVFGEDPVLDIDLVDGDYIDDVEFTYESPSNARTVAKVKNITIRDSHGRDVTDSYNLSDEDFTIDFAPRVIEVTLTDITDIYDGVPLTSDVISITQGSIAEGHTIEVTANGSQLDVGSSLNELVTVTVYEGTIDVTGNYTITLGNGTLEVTERPLIITTSSDTKVYDNTSLSNETYQITEGSLSEGHTISVVSNTSRVLVGSEENELTIEILDSLGNDVTDNYDLTYVYGTLSITKRSIEITTDSDSKVYDGTQLTSSNYTVTNGSLVTGHTIHVVSANSITNVGVIDNELIIEIRDESDNIVTDLYAVDYVYNTLSITKRDLQITTSDDSRIYNNLALSNQNYSITDGTLATGDVVNVVTASSITNVGTIGNELVIDIKNDSNESVITNYNVSFVLGTLEVTPIQITVKPEDVIKTYDGLPLTSNTPVIVFGSLVGSQEIVITTSGSITDVGTNTNIILTADVVSGNTNYTNNYVITQNAGTLEVTQRAITVTPTDQSKIYDGSELTSNELEIISPLGLVQGHSISGVTSGSITNVGNTSNVIISVIINDGTDVTDNYVVTFEDGNLEVTPREITIQPFDTTKEYDSHPLTTNMVSITSGTTVSGHVISITTNGTQTNVGITNNEITSAIILDGGVDVTDNYIVTLNTGSLEVTQRAITVKPSDLTKVYDGIALTDNTPNIISGSLVDGDAITITTSGTQTNVGESLNDIVSSIVLDGGVDVTDNYLITYETGSLKITPRFITVTTYDKSKEFDGQVLTDNNFSITSGDLAVGDNASNLTTSGIVNVGVKANEQTVLIQNGALEDVTNNYDITYVYGELEVTPRYIRVKPLDKTEQYDGESLVSDTAVIVSGELVLTHMIDLVTDGSQLNVGVSTNTIVSAIVYDPLAEGIDYDQTSNYVITYETGTLEVTQRQITVTTWDATNVYSAVPYYELSYTVTEGSIVEGEMSLVDTYVSITNVGVTPNQLVLKIIDGNAVNVTSNYDISYIYGILEVTPRPITIQPQNEVKVYDGIALTSDIADIIDGFKVFGDVINITTDGSQLNVGVSNNNILTASILDDGIDVTSNYQITYVTGTLEILHRDITIETVSSNKVYDGNALQSSTYYLTDGSLVSGHSIVTSGFPSITDVGLIQNAYTVQINDSGSNDVTDNYNITYVYGELEVTPRLITITTNGTSRVYDSNPLSNHDYVILSGNLVGGHSLVETSYTEIVNVDSVVNELTFIIEDESHHIMTENYQITYQYGTLEITPRPITIDTHSTSKEYDGIVLENLNYDITSGTLVTGDTHSINSSVNIVNVGNIDNELIIVIEDDTFNDVTSNYDITYNYGELEITPRLLSINTHSSSKEYDGEVLVNSNYDIVSGSIAPNQSISVLVSPELINASIIDNELVFDIKDLSDNSVIDNYQITYNYGTLEITQRAISVVPETLTEMYDGLELVSNNPVVTNGTLVVGETITISTSGSIINVGNIVNGITNITISNGVNDTTNNYNVTLEEGTLEVTKRPITVKPIDETKEYDGTELVSNNYETTGLYDIVDGQTVTLTTDGSQLNVGTSVNNILSIDIFNGAENVTGNYDVTLQSGSLEVTPRLITIKTGNDSKVYDGTPLSNQTYDVTEGSIVTNETLNVLSSTELTIVDVVDNIFTLEIRNASNEDVTTNYDITYDLGFLEITPRLIEISTPSDSKVYDGTALTNHSWELTDGIVGTGDTLEITMTGTITEVGVVFNTFTFTILDGSSNDVSGNYIVSENLGELEVIAEQIHIVLQTNGDSKMYDGTPLTNDEWMIFEGELDEGHTLDVTVTGTITEVGSTENTFDVVVLDASNNDVTHLYFIESTYGFLTILENDQNGDNSEDSSTLSTSGTPSEEPPQPLLEVYSELTDVIYLRDKSYGDYNQSGWDTPTVYTSPYDVTPFLFPTYANDGTITSYEITVKALLSGMSYYLPYYAEDGFYNNYNDIYVNHTYGDSYTVNYTTITSTNYNSLTISDPTISSYELEYRDFVYNNYLDLPRETEEAFLQIALENGLDPNSSTIIEDVQNYIKNAGTYDKAYSPYPDNVDIARYFLEVSREGICQHFASAGVVMYRAMGIPARYTTGFVAMTSENEWVTITDSQAHAWVEIYIDGFGWVPVEVTGSGSGGSSSGFGSNPTGGSGSEEPGDTSGNEGGSGEGSGDPAVELVDLTIYSINDAKVYDGTPLENPIYYHSGTLKSGHILSVQVTGTITSVGETENTFTYVILDGSGVDVTSEYNITPVYGSLVVVPNNELEILELQVYDLVKGYDGTEHTHQNSEFWIPSGNLPANYTVTLDIMGGITNVGKVVTTIDESSIVILDGNGIDVTNNYNVVTYSGSITVSQRSITVSSYSAQKDYDGTELTNSTSYISQGSLVDGDVITVEVTGTITDPGDDYNTISTITIINSSGVDVTDNYDITKSPGTLTINP